MSMRHGMRRIAETKDEQAQDQGRVIVRLIRMLRPYWLAISVSFLLMIINAAANALGPILIGRATDEFIVGGDRAGLGRTMLLLGTVYLVSMFAMRFQMYFMSWAGQHLLADLRQRVFAKVESFSLQDLEAEESGDLMSRLVNDIDALNSFFSQGLVQAVGGVFSLIGIMVAMFLLSVPLALSTLVVVPVMIWATGKFSDWSRQAFRKTRETIGDVSADLQEDLEGVKVAQAFNRGQRNMEEFAERNAANRDANVSATAVTSAFSPVMDLLSTLDIAIVAGVGGYLAVLGQVTVGVVVSFLQYARNFARPIQMVTQVWTLSQSSLAAAERIFDLLDGEPAIQDDPDAVVLNEVQGRIRFEPDERGRGVTFGYHSDQLVLCDIRMEIQPGETAALVGPTGAGKSTLVNLIPRFYEVTEGRIRVDSHDIRKVTQRSLRSHISMVLQEPFLFSGTIRENICFGSLEANQDRVQQAARTANAHQFITQLPGGYDTEVGERGSLLSQGQKQLISIARAVLANPAVLILDEATSSVDTRTEALIQEALDQLMADRTSLVIAHRLSTVRNADVIYVLEEGKIVEHGAHQALLEKDGPYAESYRRQFFVPPDQGKGGKAKDGD